MGTKALMVGLEGKTSCLLEAFVCLLACLFVVVVYCCLGSLDHGGGGHVLVQKKGGGRQV